VRRKDSSSWDYKFDHLEGCYDQGHLSLPKEFEDELDRQWKEIRWRTPSAFAAMLLTIPMTLLNLALGTFLVGLGIYLGKAYTSRLFPSYGTGSLGILIIFVATTVIGGSQFFFALQMKRDEDLPLQRYRRLIPAKNSPEINGDQNRRAPSDHAATQSRAGEGSGNSVTRSSDTPDVQSPRVDSNIIEALRTMIRAQEECVRVQNESLQASRLLLQAMNASRGSAEGVQL
jgi:hypothetical protein